MTNFITQSQTYLNAQRQFEALPARDRSALKILALCLGILFLYFACWSPAQNYMSANHDLLEQRVELLKQVKSNSAILAAMNKQNGSSQTPKINSQQLVSTVTSMAQQQGVALKRFEPSGERELKVWVDDVAFDKLVSWLSVLKARIGVEVDQISLERQDKPGLISARLTLRS